MANVEHNTLGNTANAHGVLAATVADAAALAAVTPSATDVSQQRVWRQSDTGQLWVPNSTTIGDFVPFVRGAATGDMTAALGTKAAGTSNKFMRADATLPMPRLDQVSAPTAAVAGNSQEATGWATPTAATSLATRAYVDLGVFPVDFCTTIALPAYTYANGTAGVGATITGNANAALGTVDGGSPSVGQHILVNNGAAFSDNGVYIVTAVGDGSTTPYVLTRSTRHDTQAKILSTTIKVINGISRRGAVYEYCNSTSITFGTTALAWFRVDHMRGPNEYVEKKSDFDQQTGGAVNAAAAAGDFGWFFTISGTAAAVTYIAPAAHTQCGIWDLATGSATSGLSTISNSAASRPVMLDSSQYFEMEIIISGPGALSDGTNTYRVLAGLAAGITVAATDGLWLEYTQATSTSWLGVNRSSSSSTTCTGSTVSASLTTFRRFRFVKYAGETSLHVYDANAEMTSSPISGMALGVALTPLVTITKSAGGTGTSVRIDSLRMVQAWPNGRLA